MGVVVNADIQEGILHAQPEGIPADCGVINQAWIDGVFIQGGAASNGAVSTDINWVDPRPSGYPVQFVESAVGYYGQASMSGNMGTGGAPELTGAPALTAPTGGIVGSSILVDVANVSGYVTEPVSVQNYSTVAQHYLSSDENFYLLPSLASGSNLSTSNGDYTTVARDWGMDDKEVLPRTSVPSGINPMPIADAMLISELGNQYFLGVGTSTDYVVSAPMRKHAIYNDFQYFSTAAGYSQGDDIPVDGDIGDENALFGYWASLDSDDINASFIYWNREEGEVTPEPGDFSPPLVTPDVSVPFDREVNVLALNTGDGATSVLGSDNAQELTLETGFTNGWSRFSFTDSDYDLAGARYVQWVTAPAGEYTVGVPVHGFMSARSNVGISNVGETFPHFYTPATISTLTP